MYLFRYIDCIKERFMKNKKQLSIEELFCGIPNLQTYFKKQENIINRFGVNASENPAIKIIRKRRNLLIDTAKDLTYIDLKIIFYLNNLGFGLKNKVLSALRTMCSVQCDFEKLLNIENEKMELMESVEE